MPDTFGIGVNDESATQENPTRCLLRSYPTVADSTGAFNIANGKPKLAIDIGKDAIWVMDPKTDAPVA